jgi:hypothetical protein
MKKNKKIICEVCDVAVAVVIDNKKYYCGECYCIKYKIPKKKGKE